MITYEQYKKNPNELHQSYYEQFIFDELKDFVNKNYSVDYLIKCYNEDENLNNLGECWMHQFDKFTETYRVKFCTINKKINRTQSYSLSMGCCAIKAYMKQLIQNKIKQQNHN